MRLSRLARELRHRTHMIALGATLALGTSYVNGSCIATGQCAACDGNCAVRLPILVLPLLADGLVTLVRHRWQWRHDRRLGLPGRKYEVDRTT